MDEPRPLDPMLASLRARAWRLLLLELAAVGGIAVATVVIVAEHLRQNTAAGFGLTLVILALIVVLYINTPRCFARWRAYRRRQRYSLLS